MEPARDYAKETMAELEVFKRRRKRKNLLTVKHRPAPPNQYPSIQQQYYNLMKSYEENKEWKK